MSLTAIADMGQSGFAMSLLRERALPANALSALREQAGARAQKLAVPSVRDEEWRFSDPAPLLRHAFEFAGKEAVHVSPAMIEPFALPEVGTCLVFVNGLYAPALSRVGDVKGIVVRPFSESLWDAKGVLATKGLGQLDRHVPHDQFFPALNGAFLHEGALVLIERNFAAQEPVHLLFVGAPLASPAVSHPRCLIVAEEGSQATLVEDYVGVGDGVYWTNSVAEFSIAAGARIEHVKLQREGAAAFHVAGTAVSLARDAGYIGTYVNFGGRWSRHDVRIAQTAEGVECRLSGLALIGGRQHADTHTVIDHAKPHGTSEQLQKCVVDGGAHAVFNGKILVRAGAQQTHSAQSSRNLILSERARVDTKPELQIDADDVKCAHGATVGQLDRDEIFYLQSRGLSEESARGLLTYAFAAEVVDALPLPTLRERLRAAILEKMRGRSER